MICDHCKKDHRWNLLKTWVVEFDVDDEHRSELRHICPACANKMLKYLDGEEVI